MEVEGLLPYSILSQAEAWGRLGDDLAAQLAALASLAFGDFAGVVEPSLAWMRWYLTRPGMDRDLSGVALHQGHIVSSVFVTRLRFLVGSAILDVGFFDTVMTDPRHRRRGLARQLLERALRDLRDEGVDLAGLYTGPSKPACRLYASLGFRPYRASVAWMRPASLSDSGATRDLHVAPAVPSEEAVLCDLLNRFYAARDGYVMLDERLWRWRKRGRPTDLPAQVFVAYGKGGLAGTATFCPLRLVGSQGLQEMVYLTDLALVGDSPEMTLKALLRASPREKPLLALAGEDDHELFDLLADSGFAPSPGEVCFILPLSASAERALERPRRPWYALPESIAGV